MPDGDIFAKSLPRKWDKAGRLAFGVEDDTATVGECEKQLVRELNESPWSGFGDAVRDIAEETAGASDLVQRRRVLQDLEWYRDRWPADRYQAMRRVANRFLARGGAPNEPLASIGTWQSQQTRIASAILTDLVMMRIARAAMAERMALTGKMTVERFDQRSLEIQTLLQNAPGLQSVGMRLMQASADTSSRMQAPRSRSRHVPQSELVNMPIG